MARIPYVIWSKLMSSLISHINRMHPWHDMMKMALYLLRVCVLGHLWPFGLQPTRLLCPWDCPGKNTGVGCHFPLQGIFQTQGSKRHPLLGRWIIHYWATREAHREKDILTNRGVSYMVFRVLSTLAVAQKIIRLKQVLCQRDMF